MFIFIYVHIHICSYSYMFHVSHVVQVKIVTQFGKSTSSWWHVVKGRQATWAAPRQQVIRIRFSPTGTDWVKPDIGDIDLQHHQVFQYNLLYINIIVWHCHLDNLEHEILDIFVG